MARGPAVLLLTVQCTHAYFAGGPCPPLRCFPSAATRVLMQRCALLWNAIPGGAQVYATDPAALGPLAQEALVFLLSCDDAYLLNYSDWDAASAPAPLAQTCFYADNAPPSSTQLAPAFGASALVLYPARFTWSAPAPLSAANMAVQDALGAVVWQCVTPAAPQTLVQVDLSGQPSGRYALIVNGEVAQTFFLQAGADPRPWGAIGVFAPSGGPAANPPVYELAIGARATLWRYFVSSPAQDLDGWSVQGTCTGQPTLSFTGSQVPGQTALWQYVAQAPLALALRPAAWSIVLARQSGRGGYRLPYARGDALVLPGAEGAAPFSDIYVYL